MPQEGIITDSKGTFKSKDQIVYDSFEKQPTRYAEAPYEDVSFDELVNEAISRRDSRLKFEGLPDSIEVEIPTETPIVVGLFGDQHSSALYCDYEMLREHTNAIANNPKFYSIIGGDIIDGAAFNPAQNDKIASFSEEGLFAQKMLDRIGGDSIIAMLSGDHDMWAERGGVTVYQNFKERYNTPILRGSSAIKLKVGDIEYLIVCAHRLPGHSMYNKTHPENREAKFGQQGADVYAGFHTHQKGIAQDIARQANGEDIVQTYVSAGPYKYSDSYSQKMGFGQQREKSLGAVWLVLHPHRKEVEAYWSLKSAEERIRPYLTGELKSDKPIDTKDLIDEIAK